MVSLLNAAFWTPFFRLVALIIFGPIAGVVLDGYSFNFAGQRLAWMVGIVMLGRFLLSAFLGTPLAHASRHVLTLTARAFMSGHRNTRAACAGLSPDHRAGDLLSLCRH
jgi:hypothetical protein